MLLCEFLLWAPGLHSTSKLGNRLGHSSELFYPRIIDRWFLLGTRTVFQIALWICRLKESFQAERYMCLLQDAIQIGIWAGHWQHLLQKGTRRSVQREAWGPPQGYARVGWRPDESQPMLISGKLQAEAESCRPFVTWLNLVLFSSFSEHPTVLLQPRGGLLHFCFKHSSFMFTVSWIRFCLE